MSNDYLQQQKITLKHRSKQKNIYVKLIPALMIFLSVTGCGFDLSEILAQPTKEPLPTFVASRTTSPDFAEKLVWSKSSLATPRTREAPLLANQKYVAFVNYLEGPLSQIRQLQIMDTQTGQFLWQSERFSDYADLEIYKENAFILFREGALLNIYQIAGDSKPVFSTDKYASAHSVFYLSPANQKNLHLYHDKYLPENDTYEYVVYTIDNNGREIGSPLKMQGFYDLFLFEQPFFFCRWEVEMCIQVEIWTQAKNCGTVNLTEKSLGNPY